MNSKYIFKLKYSVYEKQQKYSISRAELIYVISIMKKTVIKEIKYLIIKTLIMFIQCTFTLITIKHIKILYD